jgi:hypothetical protein
LKQEQTYSYGVATYERRINNENIFRLQDEIANLVIARLLEFYNLKHHLVGDVA